MKTSSRWHDVVHRHQTAADGLLAGLLVGVLVLGYQKNPNEGWVRVTQSWPVLAVEALVLLSLVKRRARPVLVLVVATLGSMTVMLLTAGWSPISVAGVIAVYTVSSLRGRSAAVGAALFAGTCMAVGASLRTGEWLSNESLSILVWSGFAAVLGQLVRTKKAYVAAVEERALRAEQTREEEAGRRVIAERLRIARELHDVVAHHIAVIQVQSGVADHLLTDRPEDAREALGHVRRSSKMVLDELSGMLDVLRQPDDPITPTDPAPGLDRLVVLMDTFAASGLALDWRLVGTPQPLPSAVDLVAYRLVQEGLTNAHKHGNGSAEMILDFRSEELLLIDIVNPVPVPAAVGAGSSGSSGLGSRPGPGHGLAGMRERAHAVGGSVSASTQPDGTWRVSARVPIGAVAETRDSGPNCLRWGSE